MHFETETGIIVQGLDHEKVHYRIPTYRQLELMGCIDVRHNTPSIPPKFLENWRNPERGWDWGWTCYGDQEYPLFDKWGAVPTRCDLQDRSSWTGIGDEYQPDNFSVYFFEEKWDISNALYDHIGLELCHVKLPPDDMKNRFFRPDQLFTYDHDFQSFIVASGVMMDHPLEVDEAMFDYWLGVLPPIVLNEWLEYPKNMSVDDSIRKRYVTFVSSEGNHYAGFYNLGLRRHFMMRVSGCVEVPRLGATLDGIYYGR